MSDVPDPSDAARVVEELEHKIASDPEEMPAPDTSETSVGAVPDENRDVPGAPEPPD